MARGRRSRREALSGPRSPVVTSLPMRSRWPSVLHRARRVRRGGGLVLAVLMWAQRRPARARRSPSTRSRRRLPRWRARAVVLPLARDERDRGRPGPARRYEQALRFVPLLCGLGFLFAAWSVARALGPGASAVAGWAALVLATSRRWFAWARSCCPTCPRRHLLLGAVAVIACEVDPARWPAVALAPRCPAPRGVAVHPLRRAPCIAVIVVAAVIAVGRRHWLRRPLR